MWHRISHYPSFLSVPLFILGVFLLLCPEKKCDESIVHAGQNRLFYFFNFLFIGYFPKVTYYYLHLNKHVERIKTTKEERKA